MYARTKPQILVSYGGSTCEARYGLTAHVLSADVRRSRQLTKTPTILDSKTTEHLPGAICSCISPPTRAKFLWHEKPLPLSVDVNNYAGGLMPSRILHGSPFRCAPSMDD